MRRKKILIQPSLRDRKGDVSKKWFVEVSQRDPKTDEMVRRRFELLGKVNINSFSTPAERYQFAQQIIQDIKGKLATGWTIFNDTSRFVYEDQTQYVHEARIFKRVVESNSNCTFWISRYISEELREMGLSKETLTTYESRCRIFSGWITSKGYTTLDITSMDNAKLVEFFTYLRNNRKLSTRTYRSYIERLTAFFDYVVKQKGMSSNPVHSLPENKNVKDMGAERIQKQDLQQIIAKMDKEDRQLALACRFEYYCGLRPGYEVRLLKVGDIDFRKGVSKVRVSFDNAKVNRRREVAIPDVFLDYLLSEWRLNEYDRNVYIFGKEGIPGTVRLGKNNMRFRFNKIRKEMQMPLEYKFYSFKHTGAVTLAEQGEATINIRDHLGHQSIQTTENYLKRHGFNDSKIIRHKFPAI